jgi:hypothetical protein
MCFIPAAWIGLLSNCWMECFMMGFLLEVWRLVVAGGVTCWENQERAHTE